MSHHHITPGPVRHPVVDVGQEAAAAMGIIPGMGGRRAETMPGGMIPVIDAPAPTLAPTDPPLPAPSPPTAPAPSPVLIPDHGQIFLSHDDDGSPSTSISAPGPAGAHVDLSTIAGPSRVVRNTAIRATTTAMAFRPIEGARPPEGPGWGRAFYEPSPFDITPGPAQRPVVDVGQEAAAATCTYPSPQST
jgi:hypothetical protein